MIDTNKLKGIIVMRGKTQQDVAKMLNITPKTFYNKMKKGEFGSKEIQTMIDGLAIDDPLSIFFANEVTCEVTKGAT